MDWPTLQAKLVAMVCLGIGSVCAGEVTYILMMIIIILFWSLTNNLSTEINRFIFLFAILCQVIIFTTLIYPKDTFNINDLKDTKSIYIAYFTVYIKIFLKAYHK